MDDDFIDDDEMMYESTVIQPSQWKFGFFVWKGPIETFIDTLYNSHLTLFLTT